MQKQNVDLRVFAIEAGDFASGLAFDCAFLQIGTLVMSHLALTDSDLGFYFPTFPIKLHNNKRSSFDRTFTVELVDFLPVEKKLADAFGVGNFMTRFFI